MIRQLLAATTLLVLIAWPRPALAEPLGAAARWQVWLDTGSSIRVVAVVPDEPEDATAAFTRLVLPSGGSVRVPSDRLRRLVRLARPADAMADATVEAVAAPLPFALPEAVRRWDELIERIAVRHELDPQLVRAVVLVESAGDPLAVSPKGAVGLMQLMPATAADYGVVELTDPESNLEAGCRHLSRLRCKMEGDLELTLAAYNAGEGAVTRFGGVPAWTETRDYVQRVLSRLSQRPDAG